jgi:phosphoribosyl 1,2-cyclic phosphate phosphodiesterase
MKLQYLGTGAAERVPAIFCNCEVCQQARTKGGKENRTQTQFILDDSLLIDFPGDSYLHMLKYGIDFSKFDNLLLSHWHSDHFYGEDLAYRMHGYGTHIDNCLQVYGNQTVKDQFYDRAFELEGKTDETRLQYHQFEAYEPFKIDRYTIHPIPGIHGWVKEDCSIFVIEDGDDAILLTHDSGYFDDKMFAYLNDYHFKFSLVSLDCTGQTGEQSKIHMNWDENKKMKQRLLDDGLADEKTVFVSNHFSHNGGLTYEDMAKLSQTENIITSYDGMVIDTKES